MSDAERSQGPAPLDGDPALIRRADENVCFRRRWDKRVAPDLIRSPWLRRARRARALLARSSLMARLIHRAFLCVALLAVMCAWLDAQSPSLSLGDVNVSGSVRTRSYSWDWFGSTDGDYTYPAAIVRAAVSRSRPSYDWLVEFGLPVMVSLPSTAVAAAPQGQLGLGGSYFAANSNAVNDAGFFLKQGYVRFTGLGGVRGQSIKVGRMEFNDGAEVAPKTATLAALKRDRISQRLLGTFGFSDVGRSVDGAQYVLSTTTTNVTALAGRPTQGVFQVAGWGQLNINIFYAAVTRQTGDDQRAGEWRVFALAYDDYRHGALKTDNRGAAARAADTGNIAIGTYGGHFLQFAQTSAGAVDLLAWGALQTGKWGVLSHRAAAYAIEAGWQPAAFTRISPWIRGGYDFGSGDGNAADTRHGTFFQILPTPRIYARLPFFNLMNMRDAFGEVILRPRRDLAFRTDVHALNLASSTDLWYSGGGAFQPQTFGYAGRPSNGQTSLATLIDLSGDYAYTPRVSIAGYVGDAAGHGVAQSIYRTGTHLRFAYAELLVHF